MVDNSSCIILTYFVDSGEKPVYYGNPQLQQLPGFSLPLLTSPHFSPVHQYLPPPPVHLAATTMGLPIIGHSIPEQMMAGRILAPPSNNNNSPLKGRVLVNTQYS